MNPKSKPSAKPRAKAAAAVVPFQPAYLPARPHHYQSAGDLVLDDSRKANGGEEGTRFRPNWCRHLSDLGWSTSLATVFVLSASAAWNAFLVALNLSPNATANVLMLTGSLDNGHFWQFPSRTRAISISSTLLLLAIVVLYLHLLLMVLRGLSIREKVPLAALRRRSKPHFSAVFLKDGNYRKIKSVVLELPEVVLQVLALRTYMRRGLDEPLLYMYACLMALNAFLVVYHVLIAWREQAFRQIFHDALLDTVFAVFFPALVLIYSVITFHGDLTAVKITQRFFPPSAYERTGRVLVDARQINTFSAGYESLLLVDLWNMFLQIGFNLLTCLRWHRIICSLLERTQLEALQRHRQSSQASNHQGRPGNPPLKLTSSAAVVPVLDDSQSQPTGDPVPKRAVPAIVGVAFLIYGIACVASAATAIRSSQVACEAYSSCILISYVWPPVGVPQADGARLCNCLAFVDRDLAPNASEMLLPDVSIELAEVARAGSLETIQLVNRRIKGTLPDEVSRCTNLRSLILIYTGIETLPTWANEAFTQLEYLHIQGSTDDDFVFSRPNDLLALPVDFFSGMAELKTLQLSGHGYIKRLSPLESLPKLQMIYLGELESLDSLPAMGDLPHLQVAAFLSIPHARTLPDLSVYQDTLETLVVQDVAACCSGFLSGGSWNTSVPTCCTRPAASLEESETLPSNAILDFLERFTDAGTFCDASVATCRSINLGEMEVKASYNPCNGVLYRQCSTAAKGVGICYNLQLGRVQCVFSESVIAMRKAAIAAGCSCDAQEEQWLGCD